MVTLLVGGTPGSGRTAIAIKTYNYRRPLCGIAVCAADRAASDCALWPDTRDRILTSLLTKRQPSTSSTPT